MLFLYSFLNYDNKAALLSSCSIASGENPKKAASVLELTLGENYLGTVSNMLSSYVKSLVVLIVELDIRLLCLDMLE